MSLVAADSSATSCKSLPLLTSNSPLLLLLGTHCLPGADCLGGFLGCNESKKATKSYSVDGNGDLLWNLSPCIGAWHVLESPQNFVGSKHKQVYHSCVAALSVDELDVPQSMYLLYCAYFSFSAFIHWVWFYFWIHAQSYSTCLNQ